MMPHSSHACAHRGVEARSIVEKSQHALDHLRAAARSGQDRQTTARAAAPADLQGGRCPAAAKPTAPRRVAWADSLSAGTGDQGNGNSDSVGGTLREPASKPADPKYNSVEELQALTTELLREREVLQRRQLDLERKLSSNASRGVLAAVHDGDDVENQPPASFAGIRSATRVVQPVRKSAQECCARAATGDGVASMQIAGSQIEFVQPSRVRVCKSRLQELTFSSTAGSARSRASGDAAKGVHLSAAAHAQAVMTSTDNEVYPAIQRALSARARRVDLCPPPTSNAAAPGPAPARTLAHLPAARVSSAASTSCATLHAVEAPCTTNSMSASSHDIEYVDQNAPDARAQAGAVAHTPVWTAVEQQLEKQQQQQQQNTAANALQAVARRCTAAHSVQRRKVLANCALICSQKREQSVGCVLRLPSRCLHVLCSHIEPTMILRN